MYTFPEILIRWLIMGALMLFMVVVSMSHNLNDSKLQTKYRKMMAAIGVVTFLGLVLLDIFTLL